MKWLLLMILFLPNILFAQNWQLLKNNDSIYFYESELNDIDTMYGGDIRFITTTNSWINSNLNFVEYKSSLRPKANFSSYDFILSTSWLGDSSSTNIAGNSVIYKANDSLLINGGGAIGSTWLIYKDSNNIEYYGEVQSVDTSLIDNNMDSIKTILIKSKYLGFDTNTVYHNYKIILSKNNGWVKTADWYFFPFSIYSATYRRISKDAMKHDYSYGDANVYFQPGVVLQSQKEYFKTEYYNGFPVNVTYYDYSFDSIIAVTPYLGKYIVTHYWKIDAFWGSSYMYSLGGNVVVDTIEVPNLAFSPNYGLYCNVTGPFIPANEYFGELKLANNNTLTIESGTISKDSCGNYFFVKQFKFSQFYYDSILNMYTLGYNPLRTLCTYTGLGSLGFVGQSLVNLGTPNPIALPFNLNLTYIKTASCSWGLPRKMVPLSIKTINKPQIEIFPNPAYDKINIMSNSKMNTVELYNMLGQKILFKTINKNQITINILEIENGIYFFKIFTDKGQVVERVVIGK